MIAPADSEAKPKDIVIIGGGVIGICTAYYLLTTGTSNVTLVETHEVAGAASGKAGGFLALDWHGPATNDLAALSWRLHKELAKEHDGENKWGYRLLDSDNLAPKPNPALEGSDMRPRPPAIAAEVDQSWINDGGETNVLGTMASTAQVTPREFTESLFHICKERGLKIFHGRPVRLKTSANDVPESIDIQFRTPDGTYTSSSENSTLPCNDLIVTAGPWTSHVLKILGLPSLPIGNLPGHSIIVRPSAGTTISPTAVFSSIYGANQLKQDGKEKDRTTESPELFPRPDGTVYVAGENNAAPMPEDPAEVAGLMESEIADRLVRATRHVSFALAEGKVETRQLCYRPITSDGRPVIGKLKEGVCVATGHGPWGITLSTGTGKVVAELVLDSKASSADIRSLSPSRLM